MGELGRLIEAYKDREALRDQFGRRPSNADIARKVGVTRSTVGHWIAGKMPAPESIDPLARTIGEPYSRVIIAALADTGYLLRERDLEHHAAATTQAAGSAATDELDEIRDRLLKRFQDYVREADLARKDSKDAGPWLARLRADFEAGVAAEFAQVRPERARDVG